MAEVFVSYKAEDRPRVRLLVTALEAEGLSIWWDARVGGGEHWRETIAEQLEAARCVVVVWSKRSTGPDGRFVRDEATRAVRKGAYLPVAIERVEPPLGFGETQVLDLHGWKGSRSDPRYRAVLTGVHSILGREAPPVPVFGAGAEFSRRKLLVGGGAAVAAVGAGAWLVFGSNDPKLDSIAVLPFANLSGDPAQAYFSDGLAEEVRSALSRLTQLKVVARTSSEMMRNTDVKTAAKKLDVASILTGSVRRSASTIRVNAQLIDGDSGLELWSQSFDRPFGDVLQIQSGIAASVAEALSIRLGSKDRAALSLGGTKNVAAQDLLLKAAATDSSESGVLRALSLIEAAIALDPNYAEAFARKAFALSNYSGTYAHSAAEAHARQAEAIAAAKHALTIEPRLSQGYAALGSIYQNQLNLTGANDILQRALSLGSPEVSVLTNYAALLSQFGRIEDALRTIDQAIRLDPLNPGAHYLRTIVLYRGRRYREAVAYARQALKISPGQSRTLGVLALSLFMLGDFSDAARQADLLPADDMRRLTVSAVLAARRGDSAAADQFRQAAVRRYGDAAHYQYAQIDAQLGKKDRAFTELEHAWTQRDAGLASLNVDPLLDPLKGDPRFAAIVKKLNFP